MTFNLHKNADGEPMDGYLLYLLLQGKEYKWGREPAEGIELVDVHWTDSPYVWLRLCIYLFQPSL